MLQPEEVDNFYVATTESSGSGVAGTVSSSGVGAGAIISGSSGPGAQLHAPGTGLSPNRPHPERMPEGPPLTRTLDPVDSGVVCPLPLKIRVLLKDPVRGTPLP